MEQAVLDILVKSKNVEDRIKAVKEGGQKEYKALYKDIKGRVRAEVAKYISNSNSIFEYLARDYDIVVRSEIAKRNELEYHSLFEILYRDEDQRFCSYLGDKYPNYEPEPDPLEDNDLIISTRAFYKNADRTYYVNGGRPKLEHYLRSKSWRFRVISAHNGFGLNELINDPSDQVSSLAMKRALEKPEVIRIHKIGLISKGLYLNILEQDLDEKVVELTRKKMKAIKDL